MGEALSKESPHIYVRKFVQEMATSIEATRSKFNPPYCDDARIFVW